ncbi:MAG: hypothetical protein AAF845_13140 [Bacteroidota bacterium]
MAARPLRLVEFRDGPLDDQIHLVPVAQATSEDGAIEVVVDVDGFRVARYEWTGLRGGGPVVYRFAGYARANEV